jgi:tetratricopeptide (TPR) repeat protein
MMGMGWTRSAGLCSAILAMGLVSGTAMAAPADAPATPPPAAPAAEPAAPRANTPASDAQEEASVHFKRGLQLFDEGDYTLALVEFERAYQLAPNYRALYNIALVDVQLGRYADAARTFTQYLHDGGSAIAPARLNEVNRTLGELKLRTATIEIALNVPSAEVTLDGKPLDPALLKAPTVIDAGEHSLRAIAPGYQPALKTVTLAGGDRTSIRLDLVSLTLPTKVVAEAPQEHHRIFWPGFVATGALAAGAVVSGIVMANARSNLSTLQNEDSQASERQLWANRVNSAALAADIFAGTAIVAGGVSLYLSLRPDHSQKSSTLAVSPRGIRFLQSF